MGSCENRVDYYFYTDFYAGGLIPPEAFDRVIKRAEDFVDYYTGGKAAKTTDAATERAVKMACCAVAEQYYIADTAKQAAAQSLKAASAGGEIQSETVGSYSVTRRSGGDSAKAMLAAAAETRTAAAEAARQYLAGTGLLYRGGCGRCTHRMP